MSMDAWSDALMDAIRAHRVQQRYTHTRRARTARRARQRRQWHKVVFP